MSRSPTAHLAARLLGPRTTTIVDVGARWGAGDSWWRLDPLANLVGFDPDPDECAKLNRQCPAHERYYPHALGRVSGPATLYCTRDPACSSLYPPDAPTATRYGIRAMTLKETREVQLLALDDWYASSGRPEVSFLKVDTQGSELDILQGGRTLLPGCLGVEIEVEFSALYTGQPLFADVDVFMRNEGFILWRLGSLAHYSERPVKRLNTQNPTMYDSGVWLNLPAGSGRIFWGHALYVRDYQTLHDPRQWLMLAAILDAAGELDGAARCLVKFTEHQSTSTEARRELQTQIAALATPGIAKSATTPTSATP